MVTLVKEIGIRRAVRARSACSRARAASVRGRSTSTAATATSRSPSPRPTSRATARCRRTRRPIPTSTCTSSRSGPTASSCAARSATPASAANAHEIIVLPTPGDGSRRRRLRGVVRGARRHARPLALRVGVRCRRPRRVRVPGLVEAQDARDAHGVRRRVRPVGAGVPVPPARARRHRSRSAFVEYHRFTAVSYKLPLLDALVGMRRADRRDERRRQGRPHPDKLTQLDRSTPRRCGRSPRRPPCARSIDDARHRRTPTRSPPTGEVHVRHAVPRTRSSWCRTAPAASSSPARVAPTGRPRGAAGAREVLRAQPRRPRSGSACST